MKRTQVNCTTGEITEITLTAEEVAAVLEAEALRVAALPVATPLDTITALESANPITHRMLRDLLLSVGQIAGAVTGQDPMANKAVRDVVALSSQIDTLREEAKALGYIA